MSFVVMRSMKTNKIIMFNLAHVVRVECTPQFGFEVQTRNGTYAHLALVGNNAELTGEQGLVIEALHQFLDASDENFPAAEGFARH